MAGRLRPQTAGTGSRDADTESLASFKSSFSPTKTTGRLPSWTGNAQIDHETYHKMLGEYQAAKQKQQGDELKIKQLAAQLARTEEAAKRALVKTDQGAKGSTAQQLLDAQRHVQQLQAENSDLCTKLARERKRAAEFRASAEDYRRRMEEALREQRQLVRKLGEAERSLGGSAAARTAARKAAAEQEYWSEEAGRRFAVQQDELVVLREANVQLQQQLVAAVPADTAARYEASIKELQQMVQFYERQLAAAGNLAGSGGGGGLQAVAAAVGQAGEGGSGACGRWLLESLTEGGACYLWEPSSGRVFSDPPEGQWPKPVGLKHADAVGGMQLGVRGRLDPAFRALADLLQRGGVDFSSTNSSTSAANSLRAAANSTRQHSGGNSSSSFSMALAAAMQQLLSKGQAGRATNSCSRVGHGGQGPGGAGVVDARDLSALLGLLLPGLAHKEIVELSAWIRAAGQQQQQQQLVQQGMLLEDVEAAVRELLAARDAVRQGRDVAVNEALLRLRRLLRAEPRSVAAAFDGMEGQDGCVSCLQVVEVLQMEQLLPDLSSTEAHYLLALLHEWDIAGSGRHSLTDVYVALQLLALVRLPPGALSGQLGCQGCQPGSGLIIPDRPDSRLSTATSTSLTTSSSTRAHAAAEGALIPVPAAAASAAVAGIKQHKKNGKHGSGVALAWEGLGSGGAGAQSVPGAAAHVSGVNAGVRGGSSLKEAYLRERVAALEAELAEVKTGAGSANSKEVDQLRAEVARYQARLAELENDFLSLDVVANTEVTEYDAEMRKAWFTAAAFKKRYVEHKLELDSIKTTADNMQAALDDTHRALHAEAARRMQLEEAAAVARLEAGRAKELAAVVAAERAERLKLEKDYLELQSKAFAAPVGALAEVRQLREELLAARRDRAVGEAREAELRREIASLKRQLEGVSPEEHRRLVRELAEAQRQATTTEFELRAALDKLEVYRWADDAAAAAAAAAPPAQPPPPSAATPAAPVAAVNEAGVSQSQQPDEDKSVDELRSELVQLREAMALQGDEAQKLRKLLDTEAAISLEAKAALEEVQGALAAAKAEAAQQVAKLRHELDNRDEKIRRLEHQLRTAYGGLSRAALRASAAAASAPDVSGSVRISRLGLGAAVGPVQQSLDETLQALGPHENLIEVIVGEATLQAGAVSPDASTFVAWDFFLHDSQATPVLQGSSPSYNTTVRYIVEADGFMLEYLAQQQLRLEVFEARGWEVQPLGVAHMPLKVLLQDLEVGAGLGTNRAWHHIDIMGANGQQLGRLRLGFRVAKPLDKLLLAETVQKQKQLKQEQKQQQQQPRQQQQQQQRVGAVDAAAAGLAAATTVPPQEEQQQQVAPVAAAADAALQALVQAADQADADPAKASHLLISIHRCEGLQQQHQQQQQQHPSPQPQQPPQQQQEVAAAQRPYVHYSPPGRIVSHDTGVGVGASPSFNDAASWGLVKGTAVLTALQQYHLQVAVFDDAVDDPSAALLGLAAVALGPLADGIPVEGAFSLVHPTTGQPAGKVWLSIAWHNPLAAAGAGARQLKPRVPLLDPAAVQAAAAADAYGVLAGAVSPQMQQPEQQRQQQPGWPQLMQQQQPEMLAAVPMLLPGVPQQQALMGHMPSVNPAAAAAVTAAAGRKQQYQQPLLLKTGPPSDPTAAFMKPLAAPSSSILMLPPQNQAMVSGGAASGAAAVNLRYGGGRLPLERSLDGPPLGSPAGCSLGISNAADTHILAAAAAARPPAAPACGVPTPISSSEQQQQQQQQQPGCHVLSSVSTDPQCWGNFDSSIFFSVECLSLSEDALSDPAISGRHVLLAHMLLEDFTSPVQQCTETALAAGPGPLPFSYAVSYSIADPTTKQLTPAGQALAIALAAAEAGEGSNIVVPVLLASSQAAVIANFSQVECVASCELQLSDIWQGLTGDVISREVVLVPAEDRMASYPSGCVGHLRLTLVAARALQTLRQHCCST